MPDPIAEPANEPVTEPEPVEEPEVVDDSPPEEEMEEQVVVEEAPPPPQPAPLPEPELVLDQQTVEPIETAIVEDKAILAAVEQTTIPEEPISALPEPTPSPSPSPSPIVEQSVVEPEREPVVEVPPLPQVKPTPPVVSAEPAPQPVAPRQTASQLSPDRLTETATERANVAPSPTEGAADEAVAGTTGRTGSDANTAESGDGDDTPGGGTPGSQADYFTLLQAWLERHKEYPKRARQSGQQGTVTIRFTLTSNGMVQAFRIEQSSGYKLLDREMEQMIKRAQPMPSFPSDFQQNRLELVVPIVFSLR